MRCQDTRSLVLSKLNSLENIPVEERATCLRGYGDLSLKTYISGLSGYLHTNVRLRNPSNLETAIILVIKEENFLYSTQRLNTLSTNNNFRPGQRIIPNRI